MVMSTSVKDNGWYMDSRAAYHMCWNWAQFFTYKSVNRVINVVDGRTQRCIELRTVSVKIQNHNGMLETVKIRDVWHISSLQDNLLSLDIIEAKGLKVVMEKGCCTVYQGGNVFVTESWIENSNLYVLNEVNPKAMAVTKGVDLLTWHRRLGHLGIDTVSELPLKVDSMQIANRKVMQKGNALLSHLHCEPCIFGKQHQTLSWTLMTWATTKLNLIHIDLTGGGN